MITKISEFTQLLESTREVMTFCHGGNLDDMGDIAYKTGRWEHGPGLYLITQYNVVQRYARGSRKLYKVTVEKGNSSDEVRLPIHAVMEFVKRYVTKNKTKEVIASIERLTEDDTLLADTFMNIIINNDAIKNTNTNELRQFFVKNKVDYSLLDNTFGWGEKMMVLFNMDKIVNIERHKPGDKLDNWNFPKHFQNTEVVNDSLMEHLLEFSRFSSVVSFDFDGVLHLSMDDGTFNPKNFDDVKSWTPNRAVFARMRKESRTNRVVICTKRDEWNMQEIEEFVKMHKLPVQEIVCTNNMPKLPYLKKLMAVRHYDDNPNMAQELAGSGIEFILVQDGKIISK